MKMFKGFFFFFFYIQNDVVEPNFNYHGYVEMDG
jgi:hypothetical protein